MYRHGQFVLPWSVIVALMVLVGATVLAIHPDMDIRRIGWALSPLALAFIFIGLARMVWTAFKEQTAKIAVVHAELAMQHDINEEWRKLNG